MPVLWVSVCGAAWTQIPITACGSRNFVLLSSKPCSIQQALKVLWDHHLCIFCLKSLRAQFRVPEAAYYVFLKITFGLPKKLVGTCNFRVTSSHANCERRKADVRGFAEPWLSPFRLSSNLCSHRCRVCRQPEQAPGLAAPFQRVGSPSGTGKQEGKEEKETELQTQTWEVISAMPWRMGNWVSVVFGKTQVGQWERRGSPAEQVVVYKTIRLFMYLVSLEVTAARDPFVTAHALLSVIENSFCTSWFCVLKYFGV